MNQIYSALFATLFLVVSSSADGAKRLSTIGNWRAPQQGTININIGGEPLSLHPWVSMDKYAGKVHRLVLDSLLHKNLETGAWEPGLARSWSVSKDKMKFTFILRNDAKWHDGTMVKAKDVKFSFNSLSSQDFDKNVYRSYVRPLGRARAIGQHTVQFTAARPYHGSLDILGSFPIVPEKIYKVGRTTRLNRVLMGSGPYVFSRYEKGEKITLKRNPGWWGRKERHLRGYANFRKIYLHFIRDSQTALKALKDGTIDFTDLSPEVFASDDAAGEDWGVKFTKREIDYLNSSAYSFVAWNQKSPLFRDSRVRNALSHLFDRKKVNRRYFEGRRVLASGPWSRTSDAADPLVELIPFSPEKAKTLLKVAGWADSNQDGVLDKMMGTSRTEFKFGLVSTDANHRRLLENFADEARRVGIQVSVSDASGEQAARLLKSRTFEAISLSMSGGGTKTIDPHAIWFSGSTHSGGLNFIGYRNPQVDALILKARRTVDDEARNEILKNLYSKIASDAPYTFLFEKPRRQVAFRSKLQSHKLSYKHGLGLMYWWMGE